jgi:uncharacterized delta-60 repeat protein
MIIKSLFMKKFFTLLFIGWYATNSTAQTCGPLDASFGNGGKTIGLTTTGNGYPDSKNIIVQADNKIVQVINISDGNNSQSGLLRYNSDGQLDPSFGTNGKVTTVIGLGNSFSWAGSLQPDGKIVVVGSAVYAGYASGFAVLRYNTNGSLDNSFGGGGKVITPIGTNYDYATALTIQQDGKIVVVGKSMDSYWTGAFAMVRYNSNGSIDSTFAQNGRTIFHLGPFIEDIGGYYFGRYADETATAVSLQTDGRIVVAGNSYTVQGCYDYYGGIYCNSAFAMVRYNSNGTVDSSFGNNGKVKDSSTLLSVTSMALQPDDKIVVTGTGYSNGFITKKFNSNGSIDNGFGNFGTVISQIIGPTVYYSSSAISLGAGGKVIVAGTLSIDNLSQFAILRYTDNGIPDSSFNGNGTVFFRIGQSGSYDALASVALQGNKIVAGGNSRDNNNSSVVVVRLLESGQFFTPVVTAGGPLSFCNGGTVKLSSRETGTRQWYRNNIVINGATDTVYHATVSGSYTVLVNNSSGCGISSPVVVTVTIPFTPLITAQGPIGLCIGDSVTLTSNAYGGNQWYRDGVIISGSTDRELNVTNTGSYTAKVSVNGCESVASNAIAVSVNSTIPTAPIITAGGVTTFCSGTRVVLTSNAVNGNQWYKDGVVISGSTATTLEVTTGGTYTARVIVTGCGSAASNGIVVSINNNPPKPPIDWDGTKFSTSSGYAHYQWYQNDTAITGGTTSTYTPGATQFGDYKVVVTDNNNCSNTSDNKPYRVTAVSDIVIGDATLRYYPNPARTMLNVDLSNIRSSKLQAELYDLAGRLIQKQLLNQTHNQLPLQQLPSGLYQLVIYNGAEKTAVKVMVIK